MFSKDESRLGSSNSSTIQQKRPFRTKCVAGGQAKLLEWFLLFHSAGLLMTKSQLFHLLLLCRSAGLHACQTKHNITFP